MAARRPHVPDVLRTVADDRRWIARYSVKIAIVRNPWTPPDVAIRLVPFLLERDLRDAAYDGELARALRAACLETLARRPRDAPCAPTIH